MAIVAVAVGHVVELVGPDGAVRLLLGELGGEAARVFDVVVRVLVGHSRHLDQLDPLRQERVLLLLALGLRDDDDSPVALGVADDGEADPGVAGRALDDNAARLQQPLGFGILDDGKCRAVLDAAPGFMNSHLPRISQPVSSERWLSRTRGVLPMSASVPGRMSIQLSIKRRFH
jgi:hypothetical protein